MNSKQAIAPSEQAIVVYPERQLVKKDMAIRAQTKNVLRDIRTAVGPTEWLNVTDFRVGARRRYESGAAYLAGEIVELLHPVAYHRAAHDPSDC